MFPTIELNIFTVLLFAGVGLLVWFLVTREMSSTRRMKCMMDELGLDYDLATSADPATETIISKARGKCLRCRNEGLCERWLDAVKKGEAMAGPDGDMNAGDFCPNAATFKALARETALQVEPEDAPILR